MTGRGGFRTRLLDCPSLIGKDNDKCELPPNPLFNKEGEVLPRKDRKCSRSAGDVTPAGGLGVSPNIPMSPRVWGTNRGSG